MLTADNLMRLDDLDTDGAEDVHEYQRYAQDQDRDDDDSGSSAEFDSDDEREDRLITPRELEEIELLEEQIRSAPAKEQKRIATEALKQLAALGAKGSGHHKARLSIMDSGDREDDVESGPLMWYFAYGSNMNVAQLLTRVGAFQDKKLLYLPDFKLAFNKKVSLKPYVGSFTNSRHDSRHLGFANVVPCREERVYGIAYLIHQSQIEQMDVYEGVANNHYTRETMMCHDEHGDVYTCSVYVACPTAVSNNLMPSEAYLSHLLGGRGLLPSYYIDFLENHPRAKK